MAITITSTAFKYIRQISLVFLSFYALHPFINGSGCDFQLQASDETAQRYITCSYGIISGVEKYKVSGRYITYKGLYGRSGDSLIAFIYDVQEYNNQPFISFQPRFFLTSKNMHIAKIISGLEHDLILVRSPVYQIYTAKRIGDLGWW